MSKTYTPGPKADAIIARQVAKGNFATPDEAVRAGIELLEAHDADLELLRRLIDEGDADVGAGRIHRYANADELTQDVVARGEARLKRKA
jgi:putative addiction module CopG family antidote